MGPGRLKTGGCPFDQPGAREKVNLKVLFGALFTLCGAENGPFPHTNEVACV